MTLLFDALFSAVALSHFAVDILNGQRSVILAYLSIPLGLSNTTLGFFSTVYVITGALFQPVFGYLADQLGARWVVAGGILWMAGFYTLALLTPGPLALWLLVLASLGSAAFHPAGTMQATLRGRTHLGGRETTSAAYFFTFGQAGSFLGPVVSGPILDRFGLAGLLWGAIFLVPVGLNAARQIDSSILISTLSTPDISAKNRTIHVNGSGDQIKIGFPLLAFALVAAFQAWTQQNMITFVPKYLHDLGQSASVYGLFAALFLGGAALGGAVGGILADRFGKRRVAAAALLLASIPLYLVGIIGWSPVLYFVVPLAGALTGAVHSIMVVLAQRILPLGMALASGLILGFMFSAGALGTLLCGYLADTWGFPPVFQLTGGIALMASFLALTLQKN